MKLQRPLKEAITPQRQLGPVRAPPICSMKLPRSSACGLPTPLRSAPWSRQGHKSGVPAESRGTAYLVRRWSSDLHAASVV
jgi:hypothetical protein